MLGPSRLVSSKKTGFGFMTPKVPRGFHIRSARSCPKLLPNAGGHKTELLEEHIPNVLHRDSGGVPSAIGELKPTSGPDGWVNLAMSTLASQAASENSAQNEAGTIDRKERCKK